MTRKQRPTNLKAGDVVYGAGGYEFVNLHKLVPEQYIDLVEKQLKIRPVPEQETTRPPSKIKAHSPTKNEKPEKLNELSSDKSTADMLMVTSNRGMSHLSNINLPQSQDLSHIHDEESQTSTQQDRRFGRLSTAGLLEQNHFSSPVQSGPNSESDPASRELSELRKANRKRNNRYLKLKSQAY